MGARLAVGVVVRGPDGGPRYLAAGEELPDWATALVDPSRLKEAPPAPAPAPAPKVDPPPRSGAGSSTDAWANYAETMGVQVPLDAERKEIIAALDAAGVPTD